jgi:hypothetical protein
VIALAMSSKAGPSAPRGKKQRDPHTQQRIKSNALKRKGQDEELDKLRRDIAEFVSQCLSHSHRIHYCCWYLC